ncbi:Mitochondrial amidoxime-reducing component 1 [Amphibalanus amphitrite]|uniref:Mitochondrial amidoxime-reducing component 1 n=1 Tax=Amphibalanus amphitrite TaxID=1232801 RepID=A0A6A4VS71_AMPAM|nr:Mitochondrial amidoxime-reducing component 1 [Amphibalanus amphitrite]
MSVPSAPPPLLLAAAAVLAVSGLLAWRYSRRRHWVPVGTLSAISLYPLKSGAGLRCQHAQVTAFGLRSGPKLDRCLAVVCNDTILCAMSRRTIVLIKADLDDDSVTLSAPAMTPLRVPLPTEGNSVVHGEQFGTHNAGLDLGEQASKWLSDYFADGKAYTLMYFRHGSRSQLMEPLRTLRTFRLAKTKEEKAMYKDSPLLGNALGVDVEGDIHVGDTVYALMK